MAIVVGSGGTAGGSLTWGENTLALGFKGPTCAVLRAGSGDDILPRGWDPQVNSAGLELAEWAGGGHTGSPQEQHPGGKDTHICEWSLRTLSFHVGGERTAGTQQQVTASSRKLLPLEARVASMGPPASERPLTAPHTWGKMMLDHSSVKEYTEAQTPGGRTCPTAGMWQVCKKVIFLANLHFHLRPGGEG